MSFFPKKGWIYIIINSLAPGVFKMGCSTSPIIDDSGKMIGRCRGYYNHFPVGKWELVFLKEVEDISFCETKLINFFSKDCNFKNIDQSKEWFLGDWKKVKLFKSFEIREEKKQRPKKVFNSNLEINKWRFSKNTPRETIVRSEKKCLSNFLKKLGITDSDIKYKIYNRLNIHSISDLEIYENKFGSIMDYVIKETKQSKQFEKIRNSLSRLYSNQGVNRILSKINPKDLDKLLSLNEDELFRILI